ncbi:MAG: hypothetical protein OEM79_04530 [Nitrosopumilus sp.]|nr:hypothetical protein [Nitrosopumilus sp.]
MKIGFLVLGIFAISIFIVNVSAAPTIQILMNQTTFGYGEKLVYTIEVSEVTGDLAIIHIRDDLGKGSSAIPIEISKLKTEIPSPYPFEKQVFQEGKYFIDLEYSGAQYTAEFTLVDSGGVVIPYYTKQIAASWVNNEISGGFLIDAIQKTVEKDAINIPYIIDNEQLGNIQIPEWVKIITVWWLEEKISDETFANAFQHLIDKKIVTV